MSCETCLMADRIKALEAELDKLHPMRTYLIRTNRHSDLIRYLQENNYDIIGSQFIEDAGRRGYPEYNVIIKTRLIWSEVDTTVPKDLTITWDLIS